MYEFEPENHGLVWNGRDLRLLNKLVNDGIPMFEIARKLERTPTACIQRLSIIRTAMVFYTGGDDDTIKNFKLEVTE